MFKVNFYDKNGNRTDFCEFGLCEGETFYGKLEEVLYIMQELVPTHRNWQKDLSLDGKCLFNFHHVQDVVVSYVKGSEYITVRDV